MAVIPCLVGWLTFELQLVFLQCLRASLRYEWDYLLLLYIAVHCTAAGEFRICHVASVLVHNNHFPDLTTN